VFHAAIRVRFNVPHNRMLSIGVFRLKQTAAAVSSHTSAHLPSETRESYSYANSISSISVMDGRLAIVRNARRTSPGELFVGRRQNDSGRAQAEKIVGIGSISHAIRR
jgi:hypothetical protein